MKLIAAILTALLLTGCMSTPAVILDLEEDKVIVQGGLGTTQESIQQEAVRGCAIHGRRPVAINQMCLDEYCIRKQFLFACQ